MRITNDETGESEIKKMPFEEALITVLVELRLSVDKLTEAVKGSIK